MHAPQSRGDRGVVGAAVTRRGRARALLCPGLARKNACAHAEDIAGMIKLARTGMGKQRQRAGERGVHGLGGGATRGARGAGAMLTPT